MKKIPNDGRLKLSRHTLLTRCFKILEKICKKQAKKQIKQQTKQPTKPNKPMEKKTNSKKTK